MTTQYVGQSSYIIYNDEILSAPKIQSVITGGQAEINGQKSLKEAEELASNIRIGALKVELKEISHKVQSAQLGSDALSKSIKAGIIGFIIIILFLLIVYRIPGLAAGLALLTYVELMLLALNGSLTLVWQLMLTLLFTHVSERKLLPAEEQKQLLRQASRKQPQLLSMVTLQH